MASNKSLPSCSVTSWKLISYRQERCPAAYGFRRRVLPRHPWAQAIIQLTKWPILHPLTLLNTMVRCLFLAQLRVGALEIRPNLSTNVSVISENVIALYICYNCCTWPSLVKGKTHATTNCSEPRFFKLDVNFVR